MILNQWRVLLKQTKSSYFLPFFKYWCGVLLLLVWFCCLLELLTGQPRSGCSRCSCLALMIRPQEIFLKGHDDFTYKIITPWMKLFIHFYTNRWICTIWETSKERKHCQDQEGGFSKYFLLYILIIDHFYIYSITLCSQEDSLRCCRMWFRVSDCM